MFPGVFPQDFRKYISIYITTLYLEIYGDRVNMKAWVLNPHINSIYSTEVLYPRRYFRKYNVSCTKVQYTHTYCTSSHVPSIRTVSSCAWKRLVKIACHEWHNIIIQASIPQYLHPPRFNRRSRRREPANAVATLRESVKITAMRVMTQKD